MYDHRLLVVVVMGWIAYSVKKDRPLTPALHALTLGYKLPRLE